MESMKEWVEKVYELKPGVVARSRKGFLECSWKTENPHEFFTVTAADWGRDVVRLAINHHSVRVGSVSRSPVRDGDLEITVALEEVASVLGWVLSPEYPDPAALRAALPMRVWRSNYAWSDKGADAYGLKRGHFRGEEPEGAVG